MDDGDGGARAPKVPAPGIDEPMRNDRTWPSIDTVWAVMAVLLPVSATLLMQTQALDLAYHLRAGGVMLDSGSVLRTDTFTYTVAGQDWLNQQWGAQLILAIVYRTGSWAGLDLLRAALVGLLTFLVYRSCRLQHASARTAALLTLGGWAVGIQITAMLRPQLLGSVLFALCLWALAGRDEHPMRVWVVPFVVAVWANVHGSFPLAFVLVGLVALADAGRDRRAVRRLAWVALAGAGATLVTPYAWRVWWYVVNLTTDPVVSDRVAEWEPTSVDTFAGIMFFASLLAVLVLVARRAVAVSWPTLVSIVTFAALALAAFRGITWWAIAIPVLLAPVISERDISTVTAREPDLTRVAMNVVLIACLAFLVPIAYGSDRGLDPSSGAPAMLSVAPERLVDAVRKAVPVGANVYVSQVFSSWSELSAPELRVPVDARIELYTGSVWDDYFSVAGAGPGWEMILDRDDVRALILSPDQAEGLLKVLPEHPGWELLLENEDGAAYVRA